MRSNRNNYRPEYDPDSRSVRRPRSPSASDRQPSDHQSRDPRIRQNDAAFNRNEKSSTNLDGANDKPDEHDISKVIQEAGEAVYLHNSLKSELKMLEETLNRESQALDGAARLTNHKTYLEQLGQRREKLELKARLAKQKLDESEKLVKTRVGKTTQVLTSFASKTNGTSDDMVADLRRQLVQERRERQSEVTFLQITMQKQEQAMTRMRLELDTLIKSSRATSSAKISATTKKEQDILNKKIDDIVERTQRHQTDLLDFGKTLTNVTSDIGPLKTQVSEQKNSLARLNDVLMPKAEIEALTTRVEEIANQASSFVPNEFIKQSQLGAYIQKFNDHEKDYADFRKTTDEALKNNVPNDYSQFKGSTEAVLQTLVTVSKQVEGRVAKVEAELGSTNQRVGHDIKLLSDQLNMLRGKLDGTSKQVTGIEHSINGLNSRYNNLSSDTLVKKMTAVVDARRTTIHDEVVKLSERVKNLQDDCVQLKVSYERATQGQDGSDRLKDLETRHDKLEDRYVESQKDILQALAATSDQRNMLKKLGSDQDKLAQDSINLQTKMDKIVTTSERSVEVIKQIVCDHARTCELLKDLDKKLMDGITTSDQARDRVEEVRQFIEGLQARVSQLDDQLRKSCEEHNTDLTHVQEELMSAVVSKIDDLQTGLKASIEESRLLQKTENENLVVNVTEARNKLSERLIEMEKAQSELRLQNQALAEEMAIDSPTRTDRLATRSKVVKSAKPQKPVNAEIRSTEIVRNTIEKPVVVPLRADTPSNRDQGDVSDSNSGVVIDEQNEDIMSDTVIVKRSTPVLLEPPPKPNYYSRVKTKDMEHLDIVDLTSDDAIPESSSQLLAKFGASSKNTKPPKTTSPTKVIGSDNPSTPSSTKPSNQGSTLKSARDTIEKMKKPKKRKRDKQEGTPVSSGSASMTPSSKKSRQ